MAQKRNAKQKSWGGKHGGPCIINGQGMTCGANVQQESSKRKAKHNASEDG